MKGIDSRIERYSRHILLNEVGVDGQKKIQKGKVLIIGIGGLGCPAAMYLTAAGIGRLGLADYDKVDISNLQRQIVYQEHHINQPKNEVAKNQFKKMNSETKFVLHPEINDKNANEILQQYDFVIDGTDNFKSKFLINDVCMKNGIAFSHAGILRFSGQTMTVLPPESACYRCVFQNLPDEKKIPKCSNAGILGPVAGLLGSIQSLEAIKYLIGLPLLNNRLITYETLAMKSREIALKKNPDCHLHEKISSGQM